jgi:hypothetical protein
MIKSKTTCSAFFIYGIFIVLIYLFRIGGDYFITVSNFINVITPFITISTGYIAVRYFRLSSTQGKSVFFLLLAMLSDTIGTYTWLISGSPVVSFADFFWIIAYFLAVIGVYYTVKVLHPDLPRIRTVKLIIVLTIPSLFLLSLVLTPLSTNPLRAILTYGYVITDIIQLIICVLVLYIIYSTHNGTYSRAWIFFGTGTIIYGMGNAYYAFNSANYIRGQLVDLCWPLSYLFCALGFFFMKTSAESTLYYLKKKHKTTSQ